MSRVKFYNSDSCHKIYQHGLRIGDVMEIYPAIGRKKTFTLNRKSYSVKTQKGLQQVGHQHCSLDLPMMSQESYQLEMRLIPSEDETEIGEKSRYVLLSQGNTPFRINGVFTHESFLERGDVVEFGYHKLKLRNLSLDKNLSPAEFPLEEKMLKSDISILIEGETGTGKSHLAKRIHEKSGRSGRFVHINLSSFSQNLIESELFGHKKGAFTGAISDKSGAIEEAHYGSLFLDEIDSLSKELQTKLLLFLDNSIYRKVGGDGEKKADVRVIFASGSKLKKLVEQEKMRKDFYYRITSGISINLEPLRNRPERIKAICRDYAVKRKIYISESLVAFYSGLNWPGNIRQLLGHLNKKRLLESEEKLIWSELDDRLENQSLGEQSFCESEDIVSLEEFKNQYVRQVFRKYDGKIKDTAKALKLAPNTVRTMVKKSA